MAVVRLVVLHYNIAVILANEFCPGDKAETRNDIVQHLTCYVTGDIAFDLLF